MIWPIAGFFGSAGLEGFFSSAGSAGFFAAGASSFFSSAGAASAVSAASVSSAFFRFFSGAFSTSAGADASAFWRFASSSICFSSSSSMVNAFVWADWAFCCSCCLRRAASSSRCWFISASSRFSASYRKSASFLILVASARISEDSSTSTFVASFKFIVAIRRLSPRLYGS